MNIFIILLILYYEIPSFPYDARAARRAATARACERRRNTARFAIKSLNGKSIRYTPYWDEEDKNGDNYYKRVVKPYRGKTSHKWDTFYFKTRSIIDTGRVHAGDKKRKGKRPYRKESVDKIRAEQAWKDYLETP